MFKKTHNKLNKLLRIVVGIGLCVLFVVLLGAATMHQDKQQIAAVQLQVTNPGSISLAQREHLKGWLFKNPMINVVGKYTNSINLKKIEEQATLDPWVSNVEVYVDNNGVLKIEVTERRPVARVFDFRGSSFYMDSTSARMPVIPGGDFNTPVFTNAIYSKDDSLNRALNAKISFMAALIEKDSFWNAQIQQVIVQPDQSFVLVPCLGKDQKIIFGDTTNAVNKLADLLAFYKQVGPKIGWSFYRRIDLRFKGQIVASPSLGVSILKPADPFENQPLKPKKQD